MDLSQKQKFLRYEELKIQQREIEAELDTLKAEIMPLVPEGKELEGEHGKFYIQMRKVWKYTPAVKVVEDSLKTLKEEVQATGAADYTESPSLYYRSND